MQCFKTLTLVEVTLPSFYDILYNDDLLYCRPVQSREKARGFPAEWEKWNYQVTVPVSHYR